MRKFLFILLLSFTIGLVADELKIGLDSRMHPKFSQKEGRLAIDILAKEVLSKWIERINYSTAVTIDYRYTKDLIKDYEDNKIHAGLIGVREFIEHKDIILTKSRDILTVKYDNSNDVQLGFVVPKEKQNLPMSSWRGKRLAVNEAPMINDYIDLYFLENSKMRTKRFFSIIRELGTDGLAIMDLFFKKVDLAVVAKSNFLLSTKLNPQVGKKFTFLPFMKVPDAAVLIFFNESLPETDINFLQSSVDEFLKTARGEQIKSLLLVHSVLKTPKEELYPIIKSYEKLHKLREQY